MRTSSILATAALLGLTAASVETSTVTLILFGFDPQPLVGSVMGSDATATTYSIKCKPGTDASNCGLPAGGMTIAEGPSTVSMQMAIGDGTYGTIHCSLDGTTRADCTETVGGSTSVGVLTGTDIASAYMPVVVTAGAGAAATPTGAGTPGATPAASTPAVTGSGSARGSPAPTANGSSGGSASASASGASATHTNAAAQVMGGGSMMGGVVAAAAAVAFL